MAWEGVGLTQGALLGLYDNALAIICRAYASSLSSIFFFLWLSCNKQSAPREEEEEEEED
jgi:hypothetical protein